MARISGVDLPREKRVEIGLTYIYGIGRTSSNRILAAAGVNPDTRVRDLTDEDVKKISAVIDETQTVEGDLRRHKQTLKVIIETCLLTDDEKRTACRLAEKAGADFVKTSTGFSTGGATTEDVALMRSEVGTRLGVKASGGIRDKETAQRMIDAGASRLGTSATIAICS